MKKMFLAALVAFGAVSFSFGISYDECVVKAKNECQESVKAKSDGVYKHCERYAKDYCSSNEAGN